MGKAARNSKSCCSHNLAHLYRHPRLRIPGVQGVHVSQDQFLGAVAAEGGLVLAADDGKGVEDVGRVIPGEAVEVEVEGVEAGAEVAAFLFVPGKGRSVVAEVAGEGGHVVGGVGEAEDVVPDEVAGGGGAEGAVVVGGGDDGELFDDVPSHIRRLNLLTGHVIEREAIQICQYTCRVPGTRGLCVRKQKWQLVPAGDLRDSSGLSWCGHWLVL